MLSEVQTHINTLRNAMQQVVEEVSAINKLLPAIEQRANTATQKEAEVRTLTNEVEGKKTEISRLAVEQAELERAIKTVRDKLKGVLA